MAESVEKTPAAEPAPAEPRPLPAAAPAPPKELTDDELRQLFVERQAAWRAAQLELDAQAAQARIAPESEKLKAVNELSRKSRAVAGILGQALEPAIRLFPRHPEDPELTEFLIRATGVYGRRGRLEDAAVPANLLVAQGCRDTYVNLVASLAALEAFDVDSAKKYYEVVREQEANSKIVELVINRLDANREFLEHERDVRRREAEADDLPRVLLLTTQGEIEIELFEDDYPNAVAHFLKLVDTHFYDRLPFCQVTQGFGAINGCLYDDGTGGPGYEIAVQPNAEYPRMPMRGAVSLINMGEGACGSKFLISYSWTTSAHLQRTQPVIGRVIRGMDVASELNWAELRQQQVLDYDGIISARILRKRPHEYRVVTTQALAADQFNAGVALISAGKPAEAEAPLLAALRIAPRDRQILDAIALALSQQDRLGEAVKYLQRAVNADPHAPDAQHHLGKVLEALDKTREARNHYEQAVKYKPDYVEARLDLGDLLRREGEFDAAISQYSECLKYTADAQMIHDRLREAVRGKDAADRDRPAASDASATAAEKQPE
ncbi:MAG: peptidylprolyl isomerase [Planctomycetaceae bacterium]|nr:peptidylprolyl isomerase [Planctomycetaceae bacterium]